MGPIETASPLRPVTVTILNIIHHPVLYLGHNVVQNLSPSSDGNYSVGPNRQRVALAQWLESWFTQL